MIFQIKIISEGLASFSRIKCLILLLLVWLMAATQGRSQPESQPPNVIFIAIVVLWSDHGFHLGEKEHLEKFALWEKTTHVSFIIVAPRKIEPGTVIEKPVDLTTLYPTLAELCGLPTPEVDGISLLPLLENKYAEFPPALMTYQKGNHAVRTERWRYIQYADGSQERYDHDKDPHEWNNVAYDLQYQPIIQELQQHVPTSNADQVPDLDY